MLIYIYLYFDVYADIYSNIYPDIYSDIYPDIYCVDNCFLVSGLCPGSARWTATSSPWTRRPSSQTRGSPASSSPRTASGP